MLTGVNAMLGTGLGLFVGGESLLGQQRNKMATRSPGRRGLSIMEILSDQIIFHSHQSGEKVSVTVICI